MAAPLGATEGAARGIAVAAVSFGYAGVPVLEGITLSVREGEFLSLLGPCGSGKTTLLRLLAWLETPGGGTISWNGSIVRGPGIDRGVVFQDYSLFPWMRMVDNISLAIGPHEIVFRHPQLGEKRHAISVTVGVPVRLSVDMK